jgi:hypothetical protein
MSDDIEVSRCPKCRGFDLSVDIATNKMNCNNPECGHTGKDKKIDWYKVKEEYEKFVQKESDDEH